MTHKGIKLVGIVGAVLSAIFSIWNGDVATGAGLIAASLGSASAVSASGE